MGWGRDNLAEHDAAVGLQARHHVLQDADGVLVGPIMQDHFQKVDVGVCVLGREEVVSLEGDAVCEVLRHRGMEGSLDLGQVLHDQLQFRVGLSEEDGIVATRSSNLRRGKSVNSQRTGSSLQTRGAIPGSTITYIDDSRLPERRPIQSIFDNLLA